MKTLLLVLVSLCSMAALAQLGPKGYDLETAKKYREYNEQLRLKNLLAPKLFLLDSAKENYVSIDKPFSEYKKTKYVVINDGTGFNSAGVKRALAQNLPKDVTLVVLTSSNFNYNNIKSLYGKSLTDDRLKIVTVSQASGTFWARDALPVPVITAESKLSMVDAYYKRFFQDKVIADYFGAGYLKHGYRYEGGNFMPNDQGVCLAVDHVRLPVETYERYYGCRKVILLPMRAGIGHIDERVKFISDNVVVTDTLSYKPILEKNGFTVHMLPNNNYGYETYANSLLVNGTLFLPVYGRANDQKAIEIYESFGLKVVPINTSTLSNKGLGSIHCITMGYPDVDFEDLVESLSL